MMVDQSTAGPADKAAQVDAGSERVIAERLAQHRPLSRDERESALWAMQKRSLVVFLVLAVVYVATIVLVELFFSEVPGLTSAVTAGGAILLCLVVVFGPSHVRSVSGLSLVHDDQKVREDVIEWVGSSPAVAAQVETWRSQGYPITMREHEAISSAMQAAEADAIESVLGPRISS